MYPIVQTDNELLQRYINGDENALAFLLKKYQRKIFSFIMMRVKDRALAEDIFQDTFFKVIDSLKAGKYNDFERRLREDSRLRFSKTRRKRRHFKSGATTSIDQRRDHGNARLYVAGTSARQSGNRPTLGHFFVRLHFV